MLSEAVAAARDLAPLRADWMVTDAPAAVLEGVPLPPPPSSALASARQQHGARCGAAESAADG